MSVLTSERLRANAEKIMSRWEARAKCEIKASTNQDSLLLRNSLPEQLSQIADALSTTVERNEIRVKWDRDEASRVGKRHGFDRASQQSYTIDQLIFEFHILREIIVEVMEEEFPLTSIERDIITCSIEQAVNDAATEFSMTHTKIQQELIHTLAHDLRSPITAAKIITQQLMRKITNDETMVKRIAKNMDRIDLMIQDLLDVARLNAGERLPLEFKMSDLDTIISDTIEDLNFIYNNRFIYVSTGECLGLWSGKAIQRLIENLAINAVKYGTPEKEILITLDNSGDGIRLSIHNEGPPIPINEQEVLFEQFRRPRGADEKIGWGLGLVIVKAMAFAHNGTVEVESFEGKGTTFIVKFPKQKNQN